MKSSSTLPRKIGRPLSFDRDVALGHAMLAFWAHGYETTSIAELTAAMGITAPSLYSAFGDKRTLFLEAMHLYAGSPDDFAEALNAAPTAREAARQMLVSAARAFTADTTPRGCLLASATASGSPASADMQAEVAAIREAMRRRLLARIDQDVATGALPAGTHTEALAMMTIALIQGMSVLARDGTDRNRLIEMAETAMNAWPQG